MATVSFPIGFQTQAAQQQLTALHNRGQQIFARPFNVGIDSSNFRGFNKSLDQATDRVISFTATTTLLYQTGNALKNLTSQAIQVETAITGIQAILNATGSDLQKVTGSLFTIANKTGVSFYDAAAAAAEFSRAGLSLEKTLEATSAALGIVRTSGGNAQEAIQGLISTVSAFTSSNLGFQEVADKLSALDAAFSTSASGIIQAFSRVASLASDAGVNIDQLGALIATVKQISGRSEAQIGNSIKSIFVNLQNESVQKVIEGVGVATKDANGEFRSAIDVLDDLSKSYKNLTDSQRAFLTQKVAGKFQANAFQSVITGFQTGTFARGVGISSGADNDIAKRLEILNETTAITIQRFQNSITELASTLGDAVGRNFVEGLLRYGNEGLDVIKKIFEKGNPVGDSVSSGLSAALTGPGVALGGFLLVKLFQKVYTAVFQAGQALLQQYGILGGANKIVKERLTLEERVNQLLKQRATFTGPGGVQTPIIPPKGPLSRPVKPDFTAIAQRANAQAQFGQTPTLTLAAARQKYAADRAAYAKQLVDQRRQAARNRILARDQFRKEEIQRQRTERFNRAAGAGIFLVPAITSGIASQLPEGSERRQVDALGQGLSTALIGAFFGPWGAAAGVLIGAFQTLSVSVRELYGNIDDVNKVVTEQINQNNKEQQSGDLYLQSLQAYTDALASGKNDLIRRAERDLITSGSALTGDRRELLRNNSETDINKLIQRNDEFAQRTERLNNAATSRSIAEKLVVENYDGFFKGVQGYFSKDSISKVDIQPLVKSLVDSVDISQVSAQTIDNLLSGFGRSGNSKALEDFTQKLFSGSKNALDSLEKIGLEFEGGAQAAAVKIAEEIDARQKNIDIIKIETERRREQSGFDKRFRNEISEAFTNANFNQKISQLNRKNTFSSFSNATSPLTGLAAARADIASEYLQVQQGFIDEIDSAKGSFRKELQDVIEKGIQGGADRGRILGILENTIGEGFNPNNIKDILTRELGAEKTNQLFLELKPALKEFNDAVKLSSSSLDIASKQIRESGDRVMRQLLGGFGNPRVDQTTEISNLIKGQKTLREGLNAQPGDNRLKQSEIFARNTQKAKEILDTLENQGKLNILLGDDANRRGSARGAFRQLFDARRSEIDQSFLTDALNNLIKGRPNAPKFEFGSGVNSAAGFQKLLNESLQSGNFKAINESAVTQTIKDDAANGSKLAKQFIDALTSAQERFQNVNAAAETATQNFLNENKLQERIATASEQIVQNTAATVAEIRKSLAVQVDPNAVSRDALGQVFTNNARIEKLLLDKQTVQKLIDKTEQGRNVRADALLNFNQSRSQFFQGSSIFGLPRYSDRQIDFFRGVPAEQRNVAFNSPEFKGRRISPDESTIIDEIGKRIANERLGNAAIKELLNQKFGNTRGEEIFKGGVFEPLRAIQNQTTNDSEIQTLRNQLNNINAQVNSLKLNNALALNPNGNNREQILDNGIKGLTEIANALTQGFNFVFDANIGVNVNGAPNNDFKTNLEQIIRENVTRLLTEANGAPPVIAPKVK